VVLAPEAVSESSVAEVRAAVGHVLGHYRARDGLAWAGTLAGLGVLGGLFLAGLYGPAAQLMGAAATKRWNGAGLADVRGLPVVWALASLWLAIAQPAALAFDRAINLRADRFSLEHAREPDGLAEALIKGNGLQPVDPTPVELWLTCSHPALKDRIGRAMRWKAAQVETRTAAR
jgi:Zn-dependent protease with chaperone function